MSLHPILKPILTALVLFIIGTSCTKKEVSPSTNSPTSTSTKYDNSDVNSWIYSQMKDYYLWTDNIPAEASTDKTLSPDTYFYSILYLKDSVDRFSWIQESATELANSLAGKNTVLGIRTSAFYSDNTQTKVALSIAYVLKNSPAEKVGLKRGDLITQVGGVDITNDNYATILSPEALTLTLGEYNPTTGVISSTAKKISAEKDVVLTIPAQMDTVIVKGNSKIGYLHYVQFIPGIQNASGGLGIEYDNQLRTIFGNFKAKGVNELILDLRYNGGGYISSAVVLASLIGKNVNATKTAYTNQWNKNYKANTTKFTNETNNIGNSLSRLYVLTSPGTASASELVINMLRPYMSVILIGGHTYGKNVGSISIPDKSGRWDWAMQPIVLKTFNANGESNYGTKLGFLPTIAVTDNILPFKAFANDGETLFNAALEDITGQPVLAKARIAPNSQKEFKLTSPLSISDNPKMDRTEMWIENFPKK